MPAGRGSRASPRGDGELVERAQVGDAEAFAEIYQLHQAAVTREVRARIGDRERAADLVQDVFTRAMRNLASLRDSSRLRPWLLSIARHVCTDEHRSRSRQAILVEEDVLDSQAEEDPGPEELAELDELASLVSGCIRGLTQRDATALSLVTQFGFTIPQLAAALGITTGAAKVVIHRARRRLRDALATRILVRERDAACAVFKELWGAGAEADASRHARTCGRCADVVSAQVQMRVGAAGG